MEARAPEALGGGAGDVEMDVGQEGGEEEDGDAFWAASGFVSSGEGGTDGEMVWRNLWRVTRNVRQRCSWQSRRWCRSWRSSSCTV